MAIPSLIGHLFYRDYTIFTVTKSKDNSPTIIISINILRISLRNRNSRKYDCYYCCKNTKNFNSLKLGLLNNTLCKIFDFSL